MNVKILLLVVLYSLYGFMRMAQCPNTSITLQSQADVDNFSINYPGCTEVPVGIQIEVSTSWNYYKSEWIKPANCNKRNT